MLYMQANIFHFHQLLQVKIKFLICCDLFQGEDGVPGSDGTPGSRGDTVS